MSRERIHFITGKLAEFSLRRVLERLGPEVGFDYTVQVMRITVAALMTSDWVGKRLEAPQGTQRVILPGYCTGDMSGLESTFGVPVVRGPKDLRDLPEFFGHAPQVEYGAYDVEILAEINHAPNLALDDILRQAEALRADGADLIDVGCNPGEIWSGAAECVHALRQAGHRVSIDSYEPREIEAAVAAGAELVLSVNHTNRRFAKEWGCEVVVVPDTPGSLAGLEETINVLAGDDVPLRIDPILEPIGFGFAESLGRYLETRRRWPDAEIMMGLGNLTELTDVDSAGVNTLLLGFCQELGIRSILTTQVINWARTSVRECDIARRLMFHAVKHRTLPKHVEQRLLLLRDAKPHHPSGEELHELAARITDNNYRVFADDEQLHLISGGLHLSGADPFDLLKELLAEEPKNLDAGHAFYLGYEMAKAVTALTLAKDYRQDEPLDWGFLTRPEVSHRPSQMKDSTADRERD